MVTSSNSNSCWAFEFLGLYVISSITGKILTSAPPVQDVPGPLGQDVPDPLCYAKMCLLPCWVMERTLPTVTKMYTNTGPGCTRPSTTSWVHPFFSLSSFDKCILIWTTSSPAVHVSGYISPMLPYSIN